MVAKLTKEEKIARTEAKKLEALRKALEKKKEIKRAELKRILANHDINRKEIDKKCMELMLKLRESNKKKDVEILWRTFESFLDKKDHLIKFSMDLIDEAENQFQRTFGSFCDSVDSTIISFAVQFEKMSKEYERKQAELLNKAEKESQKIKSDHYAAESHLQLLIHIARKKASDNMWDTHGENLVKRDDSINYYIKNLDDLKFILEMASFNIWQQYKNIFSSYISDTAEINKKVRILRAQVKTTSEILDIQKKQIETNEDNLASLNKELMSYETGEKQIRFRERRMEYRNAYKNLKMIRFKDQAHDKHQLKILIEVSDAAIKKIERDHKKVEKILRLAAICRKYETEMEKVLPFGPRGSLRMCKPDHSPQMENSLVHHALTSELNGLWARMSRAEQIKHALEREKKLLIEENSFLSKGTCDASQQTFIRIVPCTCESDLQIISGNKSISTLLDLEKTKFLKPVIDDDMKPRQQFSHHLLDASSSVSQCYGSALGVGRKKSIEKGLGYKALEKTTKAHIIFKSFF